MAKMFECRHGGILCGERISGQTDDDVFEQAVDHVWKRHRIDLTQSQTLARYARSLIRDE